MRILVTAGSTQVPIDRVRCISNIFKGKTGAGIARRLHSYRKGRVDHKNVYVTLLTSNPELSADRRTSFWKNVCAGGASKIYKFKTFNELAALMEQEIRSGEYDAVIHSAAVSDYKVAGVMIPHKNGLKPVDASKKVSGSHPVMLTTLLDLHDADQHAGTCINDLDNNYGTKSSSIILLEAGENSDEWRYFHRERTRIDRHICAEQFGAELRLPIPRPQVQ